LNGSAQFAACCEKFIKIRESTQVVPLRLRPWQRELVETWVDMRFEMARDDAGQVVPRLVAKPVDPPVLAPVNAPWIFN
jgi:hypothetical protein